MVVCRRTTAALGLVAEAMVSRREAADINDGIGLADYRDRALRQLAELAVWG